MEHYFDDDGVNIIHDDWAAPMSRTTSALLRTVAREAPDCLLNLHSHGTPPTILPSGYAPLQQQHRILRFAQGYQQRLQERGYRAERLPPDPPHPTERRDGTPLPFNMNGLFCHVGSALTMLFESPHGTLPRSADYGYDDILEIHHQLFVLAATTN